eukprot:TRINITY_DN39519_c0_g1_i1.p2 TRINITY_DN39519_c0_g1~~TRINITY_DN39519_c0_g1_i1.p2  ORF type:complete len:387 (+),score=119.03 TRINITY_DN39519_c0_g1_i1:44-1204(+)
MAAARKGRGRSPGSDDSSSDADPSEPESDGEDEEEEREPQTADEAAMAMMETAAALRLLGGPHAGVGVDQLLATAEQLTDDRAAVQDSLILRAVWAKDIGSGPPPNPLLAGVAAAAAAPQGTPAAVARRLARPEPPAILWVCSPAPHLCGQYAMLEGTDANGHPVWQKDAQPVRYLFSTHTSRWRVTDDKGDFAQGGGYMITAAEHGGAPPHECTEWLRKLGQPVCAATHVTATLTTDGSAAAASFLDSDGDRIEVWACAPLGCKLLQYAVNGVPRPPCRSIEYDDDSRTLDFPEHDLSVELPWRGFVLSLQKALAIAWAAGVDVSKLPADPTQEWLSEWRVEKTGDGRGRELAGRTYFWADRAKESCWQLGRRLREELGDDTAAT